MPTTKQIAEEVSMLMPVIARKILLKFFQASSLSQTQIFTIMTLNEQSPCRLNELSEKLGIAAPTTTGIIDRLEKSGYARRFHDNKDRRVVNVTLTGKGQKLPGERGPSATRNGGQSEGGRGAQSRLLSSPIPVVTMV